MNIFINWLSRKSTEQATKEAEQAYQIREFNNELWLTYNGALICPTDMLYGDDSVKALQNIRKLYVERNATDYERE